MVNYSIHRHRRHASEQLIHNLEGVPKKRGPKKESLSALIKRIDGLEELLKSDKTPTPPGSDAIPADFNELHVYSNNSTDPCGSASSDVSPYSAFHEGSFGANKYVERSHIHRLFHGTSPIDKETVNSHSLSMQKAW